MNRVYRRASLSSSSSAASAAARSVRPRRDVTRCDARRDAPLVGSVCKPYILFTHICMCVMTTPTDGRRVDGRRVDGRRVDGRRASALVFVRVSLVFVHVSREECGENVVEITTSALLTTPDSSPGTTTTDNVRKDTTTTTTTTGNPPMIRGTAPCFHRQSPCRNTSRARTRRRVVARACACARQSIAVDT